MMQQTRSVYLTIKMNETDLAELFRLAVHLFLHLVIRELPPHSNTHQKMSEQLQLLLPNYMSLEMHGALHSSLSLLLWVLFIGGMASLNPTTIRHFSGYITRVSRALGIRHQDEFIHNLRQTLWAEAYCYPASRKLWEEIKHGVLE
jgi:hypothetical protein